MATIYDIANIKSGDPMGVAREGAREASTVLAQFKEEKKKIEEINAAIEDAKRKQNKNKLGYGLLGTILGGALTGGMSPFLQALVSGAVSGGVEKYRQNRVDSTEKLEALEEKYKDTNLGKSIGNTVDVFKDANKEAIFGDLASNLISSLILPTNKDWKAPLSDPVQSKPILSGFGEEGMQMATPGIEGGGYPLPINNPLKTTLNEEMLEGFFPKATEFLEGDSETAEKIGSFIDKNPMILSLLKTLGPTAYGQLTAPKPYVDPYTMPTFRNPYRGGGY